MSVAIAIRKDFVPLKMVPLAELVEFRRGLTYKKSDEVVLSSNAVLRANNVDLETGSLDLTDIRFISDGVSVPASKKILKDSLLICTASGSRSHLGKIAYVEDDFDYAFGGFMGLVVPGAQVLGKFLYYFTRSTAYSSFIDSLSAGANINNLRFSDLGRLLVPFPQLDEQKRIIAVLDQAFAALDRARTHAEANLADADELFENALFATFDELVSSADMRTLAEAASDFSRGKSRHRPRNDPALYDGDYPFIQMGDIRKSQGSIREYSQTYNDVGLAQSKLWPVGTVCITIAANIAETGVLEFESCFPDSVIGMVPTPGESSPYYVEYMLRYFAKELKLQGKGSAQDNINLATFEHAKFPFPLLERQMAVVEKLDSLATEVAALRTNYLGTLADLANLRQSLLQKAFSGQLT